MDKTDVKILDVLQTNASLTPAEVALQLDLDEALCAERINALEDENVIQQRVALLNARKVGANMIAFVAITTPEHSEEWLENFHSKVMSFPEVVEFYRMSGQVDYLLRVVISDIEAYDVFYKKLISTAKLKDVTSTFAIEQIKYTTKLPLSSTMSE